MTRLAQMTQMTSRIGWLSASSNKNYTCVPDVDVDPGGPAVAVAAVVAVVVVVPASAAARHHPAAAPAARAGLLRAAAANSPSLPFSSAAMNGLGLY